MTTRKLFKENVYLKEAEATVLSLEFKDDFAFVILNQTIFFPEGGGQTSDIGTINSMSVVDVQEKDDEIVHKVLLNKKSDVSLDVGKTVTLKIDWHHRFDNMQRHCGEHILTGIFYRDYKLINRGFHMGDDYMTIDLAIEDEAVDSGIKEITWDMCLNAELEANKIIWEDMPMITRHFDTYEEASKEPMRKKLVIEKDITLVGIGKPEYDWGCVACCGTHPSTTGQVGLIKIFKLEPNKGMFRIYFESGERAYRKYQNDFETISDISKRVSAGTNDLIKKFDAQEEKNKEKFAQFTSLRKYVVKEEAGKVLSSDLASFHYDILTIDDMMAMAKDICPNLEDGKIIFLVHDPTNTILLLSNGSIDCSKLVRENVSIYNGKGGGSKEMARAIFDRKDYVETFMDLLEKHLR